MLTLRELQTAFSQSVIGEAPGELLDLIEGDGFAPAARLSLYRTNVATRLTDTLSAAFPVVRQLVDPRFFEYAAEAFQRQHLPTSGRLSKYGADFPAFLAGFPPAAEPRYLADVARLEWAIHEVRHAATVPAVSIDALAAMSGDPTMFKLMLSPAIRFVASPFGIDQIWIAHQPDGEWERLRLATTAVRLQLRHSPGLRMVNLPPPVWTFRAWLAAGNALGPAVAAAFAESADFDPPSALAALFADGLVVRLT